MSKKETGFWEEIKNKKINLYGFSKSLEESVVVISDLGHMIVIKLKASAALPAIDAALNTIVDPVGNILQDPRFKLELLDNGYVTISKI